MIYSKPKRNKLQWTHVFKRTLHEFKLDRVAETYSQILSRRQANTRKIKSTLPVLTTTAGQQRHKPPLLLKNGINWYNFGRKFWPSNQESCLYVSKISAQTPKVGSELDISSYTRFSSWKMSHAIGWTHETWQLNIASDWVILGKLFWIIWLIILFLSSSRESLPVNVRNNIWINWMPEHYERWKPLEMRYHGLFILQWN